MVNVRVFDHNTKKRPQDDPFGKLIVELLRIGKDLGAGISITPITHGNDTDAVDDLSSHEIAIAHIFPHDFKVLADKSKTGSVCVRVSSEGLAGKRSYKTTNGVNCLYLLPSHTSLNEGDWLPLLKAIIDQATVERIVNGQVPPELRRYFMATSGENLAALSILCQGYLVAFASSQKLKEEDYARGPIKDALNKMGGWQFLKDESNKIMLQKAADGYKDAPGGVLHEGWWTIFPGSISEAVSNEIISLGVAENEVKRIVALISKIQESPVIQDPELVACAYLELSEQRNRLF